jgi:hypothetical protein
VSKNPITKAMRTVIEDDPDGSTSMPVLLTHMLCALACLWDKLDAIHMTLIDIGESDPERSDPTPTIDPTEAPEGYIAVPYVAFCEGCAFRTREDCEREPVCFIPKRADGCSVMFIPDPTTPDPTPEDDPSP